MDFVSTCSWCGREFNTYHSYMGFYCSKKCYEEEKASRESREREREYRAEQRRQQEFEAEQRRQQELEAQREATAHAAGYASYADYDDAKSQDIDNQVAKFKASDSKEEQRALNVIHNATSVNVKGVSEIEKKRRLASFLVEQTKDEDSFYPNKDGDWSDTLIYVSDSGVSTWRDSDRRKHKKADDQKTKDEAKFLLSAFRDLTGGIEKTKWLSHTIENELYTASVSETHVSQSLSLRLVVDYLMTYSEGVEDILEPALARWEKNQKDFHNKKSFVQTLVGTLISACAFALVLLTNWHKAGCFFALILSCIGLATLINATDYRKKIWGSLFALVSATICGGMSLLLSSSGHTVISFIMQCSALTSLLAFIFSIAKCKEVVFGLNCKKVKDEYLIKKYGHKGKKITQALYLKGFGSPEAGSEEFVWLPFLVAIPGYLIADFFTFDSLFFGMGEPETGSFMWAFIFILAGVILSWAGIAVGAPGLFNDEKKLGTYNLRYSTNNVDISCLIMLFFFTKIALQYFLTGHNVVGSVAAIGAVVPLCKFIHRRVTFSKMTRKK
ncbi:MAG: cation:proton antiporter [Treponema sp.]|nr:cation:proton antiporter [Treponema sp.]